MNNNIIEQKAKELQKEYFREYREKNHEKLLEYNRAWRKNNPQKVRDNTSSYWIRKAEKELKGVK